MAMALQQSGGGFGQSNGRAPQPGDILIAIHDFDARSGDELTLRRSERVELIELDEGFGDGWYLGRHLARGITGLFPGVYTTKAPPAAGRTPLHTPTHSHSHFHTNSQSGSTTHNATTVTQQVPRLSISSASPASSANRATTTSLQFEPASDSQTEIARSSLPAAHHTTYVQRTIGEALGAVEQGQDSPVMNETLNVIDEHITNLSTPRQSLANNVRDRSDSVSDYSSHLDRQSFYAGPETDEEDNAGLDEATVRSWDQRQTAQHLRNIGVDSNHCDIFEEQEITGDVLLDMDQNFVYMKEFDFGVMGRRLKTWHKIRDFQKDVKSQTPSSRRASEREQNSSLEDVNRVVSNSSIPRSGLAFRQADRTGSIAEERNDMPHPLQPSQASKRTSWTGTTLPASSRVVSGTGNESMLRSKFSSASDRSRRHSSIDFGAQPDLDFPSLPTKSHQQQSSMDKTWSFTGSSNVTTPASSIRPPGKMDMMTMPPPPVLEQSPTEFDRGYFSGNDIDSRKNRNRLSKSPRLGHSRQTSLAEQPAPKRTSMMKRHARLSSVGSTQEESSSGITSASKQYGTLGRKGRFRSSSAITTSNIGLSPTVTNLENDSTPNIASPTLEKMRMQDRARKMMGFRTASEAVTVAEKSDINQGTSSLSTVKSSELLASPATGDTSPSGTPSLDMETPEGAGTPEADAAAALSKNAKRPRPNTKQRTSAYTHGLMKIPPAEARQHCDHYGWMKKRSAGIMSTWKSRLFILRGRRLSYYYSESDTEERGIIDISGHKVLVANDDPTVTIHASVTGANKASSTPKSESEPSSTTKSTPVGVFYFKLVPPKSGTSRAVQFTKPTIHYFQVDSILEGRKWMGEIMKATIDHDLANFESTNKQKTISLAKARARRERPPGLDDTKKVDEEKMKKEKERLLRESGLGIEFTDSAINLGQDQPSGSTSPKALSTLGLGPRTSLTKKIGEDQAARKLSTISDEGNKENTMSHPG